MGRMRLSSTTPPTTLRLHSWKTVEKKKMNRRKMRNLLDLGMKQRTQRGLSLCTDKKLPPPAGRRRVRESKRLIPKKGRKSFRQLRRQGQDTWNAEKSRWDRRRSRTRLSFSLGEQKMPPKSEPGSPGEDRLVGVQPVRQKRPFTAVPLLSALWQSMLGVRSAPSCLQSCGGLNPLKQGAE